MRLPLIPLGTAREIRLTSNASHSWSRKTAAEKATKPWNKSSSQIARQNLLRAVSLTASWLLSAMEKSKAKPPPVPVSQLRCPRLQHLLQQTPLLPGVSAHHLPGGGSSQRHFPANFKTLGHCSTATPGGSSTPLNSPRIYTCLAAYTGISPTHCIS